MNLDIYKAEVIRDIESHPEWREEMERGKMFGILAYEGGYLKAYSGQILGRSDWEGYVPPVFDYLQPDGYFKHEEAAIVAINNEILRLETSDEYAAACAQLKEVMEEGDREIEAYRQVMAESKQRREALRRAGCSDDSLIGESQFQKAELRRIKRRVGEAVERKRQEKSAMEERISALKTERRQRSEALQQWLFSNFRMLNAEGEEKNLLDIFTDWAAKTGSKCVIPPAGSGECCAPKLLQYAYRRGIRPLAVSEFWYVLHSPSPSVQDASVLRIHGRYYEPCQSKCVPILNWMLPSQSILLFANRHATPVEREALPEAEDWERRIIYESADIIVVNKPHGVLSVPGKTGDVSVLDILRSIRPDCGDLMMAHRLDMDTSGILVAAKNTETYRRLQRLFAEGKETSDGKPLVRKEYLALLESELPRPVGTKGTIDLPLLADYVNRPMQCVDYKKGKPSVTHYEVLAHRDGHTLLRLIPVTGRTHQLRVHCAHPQGIGIPILGDRLYGHPDKRLYLHAAHLEIGGLNFDSPQEW